MNDAPKQMQAKTSTTTQSRVRAVRAPKRRLPMKTRKTVGRTVGEAIDSAAACVPTTWLDPMLTGPKAVIGLHPWGGPDIERLLNAVRGEILKLKKPK
jgi:hypothetical protein